MVTNFEPLLLTLVIICVKPIDPRCEVTVLVFLNWRCNNNADDYAVDNGDK